jgi:3D (Asp-Asp-Asp) domain-containing protein
MGDIMYKKLASLFILGLSLFVGDSVFSETETIPHESTGRVMKPHKLFRGAVIVSETIRIVTAYNAGDPDQNHGNPCIAASGENLCKALSIGKKRCAANFVPLGTKLHIEKYGIFVVTDRTNKRYRNRVDIAMKLNEIHKAKQFGKKKLNVKILRSRKVSPPKQPTRLATVTQPIR